MWLKLTDMDGAIDVNMDNVLCFYKLSNGTSLNMKLINPENDKLWKIRVKETPEQIRKMMVAKHAPQT